MISATESENPDDISNHFQTQPLFHVLRFPGFSRECTAFSSIGWGVLSPTMMQGWGWWWWKIKDQESLIAQRGVTSMITGWHIRGEIFTQLTKRQSGFSLHLCQQAARLRAFVRRPRTLCPLRLVLFLKSFLHSAQERATLDWQDWLENKTITGYLKAGQSSWGGLYLDELHLRVPWIQHEFAATPLCTLNPCLVESGSPWRRPTSWTHGALQETIPACKRRWSQFQLYSLSLSCLDKCCRIVNACTDKSSTIIALTASSKLITPSRTDWGLLEVEAEGWVWPWGFFQLLLTSFPVQEGDLGIWCFSPELLVLISLPGQFAELSDTPLTHSCHSQIRNTPLQCSHWQSLGGRWGRCAPPSWTPPRGRAPPGRAHSPPHSKQPLFEKKIIVFFLWKFWQNSPHPVPLRLPDGLSLTKVWMKNHLWHFPLLVL